ncbi:MAG TPA: SusC/RagA family TonB-linked outer membrane protein, partial [Gemmatimonadales bacterium]|nr:SusC/RagA family TonB-linked outer membrane protein [Gemmatimonadales bacterium]
MRRLSQIGLGVLLVPLFIVTAQAQEIQVSGTVTSALGEKLWGVMVRVQGTTTRTVTDQQGHYNLSAPSDGVLTYALIGFKGATQPVNGRTTIDVTMEQSPTTLEEVIVTGYQSQRRGDITGAISSLNIESAEKQTSTSVLQRLDGQVPGVTVEAGGSPGSRTTVRIRGVSSFQNNDPLYIVDGTPVQDSYLNWLNPAEIASMQVLKDASTASIYGSRANNGVVVIETKKGHSGGGRQIQLDVRTGVANAVKGYDSFMTLNALDYQKVVKTSYENAGLAVPVNIYGDPNNPTVPAYIWPNDGKGQSCAAPGPNCTTIVDPSTYLYPTNLIMPGSAGTNWWKAVFGSGQYRDANLAISGGGLDNSYHVSFNFLDQEGTAAYTRLQRGGVRVNTSFNVGKVNVGENVAVSRERHYGGLDDNNLGEDNIIGKNIFQQPVVPIYDVGGNFASGKATGLSNLTNPLKIAFYGKDNITNNDRIFGNVFAGIDAAKAVKLQTRFGFNLAQSAFKNYAPTTFENSEVTDKDAINENYNLFTDWTWSNTLNWTKTKSAHNLALLLGQEANENNTRFETGSCGNLLNPSVDDRYIQDALCDPTTKNVFSTGTKAALLSFFGKADYNYGERYYLSLTVRRDGSSRFGPDNRWATFPAVGLGWRLSREGFF